LAVLIVFTSLCNPSSGSRSGMNNATNYSDNEDYWFPYDLEMPYAKIKLPSYLEEISGLSYYRKDKLVCIQDEKANIYVLAKDDELKISKYDFGKDADYEGIAFVDKTAYVLRNDGQIFRVEDFKKKDPKVKKFDTPLSEKNDTEGIAYDALTNSLLIACKGSPAIEKDNPYSGYKAIYRFDLKTKDLIEKPLFLVDLKRLDSYRDQSTFSKFSLKLAKKLRLVESETSFKPSGIAIHPIYGDIYIISSVGKLLIVLDRRGKVLDIHDLDNTLFRQPEGICFSPSADLFISNEGDGGKGTILKFNLLTNE